MIRFAKPALFIILLLIISLFFIVHVGKPAALEPGQDRRVSSLFVPEKENQAGSSFFLNRWDDSGKLEAGDVIMSELGNATIKAELGRSSWRLIHTVAARFPANPTTDEQNALKSWIYLFSRLYPCGECARHFQGVLVDHPPKVSSRNEASQWACDVHNVVNLKLEKPMFNCSEVLNHWKCGCDDAKD